MTTTQVTFPTNQEETKSFLSKFGLKSPIYMDEVEILIEKLKQRIGDENFYKIAREVYFNLNKIPPGQKFDFKKYFMGENLEVFMVVTFRYFFDHSDYTFTGYYDAVKRYHSTVEQDIEALDEKKKKHSKTAAATQTNTQNNEEE